MLDILKDVMLYIGIISLFMSIFSCVCMWRVFTKAGVEGWWSLIPVINYIKLIKISKMNPTLLILGIVGVVAGTISSTFISMAIFIVIFGLILSTVSSIWLYFKLFECFGLKGIIWFLIALLLPLVGCAIIAFNPYVEYEW